MHAQAEVLACFKRSSFSRSACMIIILMFQSPIHVAAAASNSDKCLELMLSDVDDPDIVNATTKDLRSPLHLTAIRGNFCGCLNCHVL